MLPADPTSRPLATVRERFVADLASRRAGSGKSFAALARELDHPRSTLHGWCRGDHLPFPRDDATFERLLRAIGIDDVDPWLATLRSIRGRNGRRNPYRGLEPYTEQDADRFHGRDALAERLVAAVDGAVGENGPPLIVVGASGSGKTSLLRAGLLGRLQRRDGHATAAVTPGDAPVERIGDSIARLAGAPVATLVVDQFEELFTIAPADQIDGAVSLLVTAMRAGIGVVIGVRADFFQHLTAIPVLLEGLDRRQIVVGPMTTRELTDAIVIPATHAGIALTPSLVAHLVQEFDAETQRGTHALPLLSHVMFRLVESAPSDLIGLTDYLATGGLRHALQRTADEVLEALPAELHATCRTLFLQLTELRDDTTPTRRAAQRATLDRFATPAAIDVVIDAFVSRRLLTVERSTVTLTHEALLTAWPTLREWVDDHRGELLVGRRVRGAHHTWIETGRSSDALLRGSLLDEALVLIAGPLRMTLDDGERAYIEASSSERDVARARDAAVLSRQIAAQSDLLGARDPSLSGHLALEASAVADTVEARSAMLRCSASMAGPRFAGPTGPSAVTTAPGHGRAAAAFYATGAVEGYELADGMPARTTCDVAAHHRVHAIALDAACERMAVATRLGRVTVVDGQSTVDLGGVDFEGAVYAVVLSPDGGQVLAAGSPPGVARWRQRVGLGWELDHLIARDVTTMGLAVRWSDDVVATASTDGLVSLWDGSGRLLWAADARPAVPVASAVAFAPDGRTLAAGYHDGSVRVWAVTDPTAPIEQPLGSAAFATWVNGVDFSTDGRVLAAASSDGTVRLWDTTNWRELRVDLRHPSVVSGVRFLTDRWLITSSEDGIIRTWDVSNAVTGSDASVWGAAFDDHGAALVTASRRALSIDRREGNGRARRIVPAPEELQLFSGVCDMSADGALIAAGTHSGAVMLVDAATATPLGALRGTLGKLVEGVAVLGRTGDATKSVTIVAVDSSGCLHRWVIERRTARSGRDETDGSAGVDGVHELVSDGVMVCAGTALAVVDLGDGLVGVPTEPGDLVIVDAGTTGPVAERTRFRPGDAFPISVARRPGHRTIVTGGADRAVSVWSIADWDRPQLVERVVGPAGHVMSVDIDRTGRRLAVGTTDGRIWVWEWDDADRLHTWATIETGEAGVYVVRFSPDGHQLVSAGPNHRVTWWPLDVGTAAALVRRRIGDPLTDHERDRLLPRPVT